MILFINACVREDSRTKKLADALLSGADEVIEEVKLSDIDFPKTDGEYLKKRDSLIAAEKLDDPMFSLAVQFASADKIVIAAPYWDLSFPAALKQYFEHINVLGVTFVYTAEGVPKGLCKAEKLYYITTAGGGYAPEEFGFGYVKALAQGFYGIGCVKQFRAVGLDIYGADEKGILSAALGDIQNERL